MKGGIMDRRIKKVVESINKDEIERAPSLKELAHSMNLSYSRLRHLFKSEMGVTPTQYLRLLRMQQTRELLETTYLSVKEIMATVGVNDESHFVREFKRMFGQTPTEYRMRQQSEYKTERPGQPAAKTAH
jgi:AraC family transcriptional regulator of arabinose operon